MCEGTKAATEPARSTTDFSRAEISARISVEAVILDQCLCCVGEMKSSCAPSLPQRHCDEERRGGNLLHGRRCPMVVSATSAVATAVVIAVASILLTRSAAPAIAISVASILPTRSAAPAAPAVVGLLGVLCGSDQGPVPPANQQGEVIDQGCQRRVIW